MSLSSTIKMRGVVSEGLVRSNLFPVDMSIGGKYRSGGRFHGDHAPWNPILCFFNLTTITMPGRTGISGMGVNRSCYNENIPKRRMQRPSGMLNCNAGVVKTPGFDALQSN